MGDGRVRSGAGRRSYSALRLPPPLQYPASGSAENLPPRKLFQSHAYLGIPALGAIPKLAIARRSSGGLVSGSLDVRRRSRVSPRASGGFFVDSPRQEDTVAPPQRRRSGLGIFPAGCLLPALCGPGCRG